MSHISPIPPIQTLLDESHGAIRAIARDCRCDIDDVISEVGWSWITAQRGYDPGRGNFSARVLFIARQNLAPQKKRKKKTVKLVFESEFPEVQLDELADRNAEFARRQAVLDPLEILLSREAGFPRWRTDEPPKLHFKGSEGRIFEFATTGMVEDEIVAATRLHPKTVRSAVDRLEKRIRAGDLGDGQADFFEIGEAA